MTARGMQVDDQGKLNNFAIEPTMYEDDSMKTGFTEYSEKMNGRLAMIGFISVLAFEVITGQGLLQWFMNL
jgi:hypothetical protein